MVTITKQRRHIFLVETKRTLNADFKWHTFSLENARFIQKQLLNLFCMFHKQ